jgi:hypothetical protein
MTLLASGTLDRFFDTMFSFEGMIGVTVLVILFIAAIAFPGLKWILLTAMFYFSTMGIQGSRWFVAHFFSPLQQIVENGRSLTWVLLALLLVPTFLARRGWRRRVVAPGLIVLLIFHLLFTSLRIYWGFEEKGWASLPTYILLFASLGYGLGKWLQSTQDAYRLINCMAYVGAIFAGVTVLQLVIDRSGIIENGRLVSTCITATFAAELIAVTLLPTIYLIALPGMRRIKRIALCISAALLVVFLIWTGTRTGLLMALIGVLITFRARLGRFIITGILLAILVLGASTLFQGSFEGISRLTSTSDTRTAGWRIAFRQFVAHPVLGMISSEQAITESSFISAAAYTGVIGSAILFLAMFLLFLDLFRAYLMRSVLKEHATLVDLAAGGIISLVGGAFLEGYLLGVLAFQIIALYFYVGLLTYALDYQRNSNPGAIGSEWPTTYPSLDEQMAFAR